MNRIIKFRAWDKMDKKMYYNIGLSLIGVQVYKDPDTQPPEEIILDRGRDCFEIMQFTGLYDKNGKEIYDGKEIYEGDIVTWSDGDYESPSNPRIAEVRFDPELCFFAFNVCDIRRGQKGHKFGFSNFIYTDTEKHLEVIGNIYENPDLLTNQS